MVHKSAKSLGQSLILLKGVFSMCLICVEFFNQRMTREEMKKALPEMVMFAKTEEERNHFKKLQSIDSPEELEQEVKQHLKPHKKSYDQQNDYKVEEKNYRSRF